MNRIAWVGLLAVALTMPVWAHADGLDDCAAMLQFTGAPEYKDGSRDQKYLCRMGYVLSHNNEERVPDWVLEVLTNDRLAGNANRKDNFKADADLSTDQRAELSDYKGSGFDRGHMAPADDMKWNQAAMDESFYLSNMAPQQGRSFNQGIWKDLEQLIQTWVSGREPLVVITGPIYADSDGRIPKCSETERARRTDCGRVRVPHEFYKIIYHPGMKRVLAFVLRNTTHKGSENKAPDARYKPYQVTVREIEDLTGINFLAAVPARDQNRIERVKGTWWRSY